MIKNPEYTEKIIRYITREMNKGKTWDQCFRELGEKANIEGFDPGNPKESELIKIAECL